MHKIKYLVTLIVFSMGVLSCDEFLEEDVRGIVSETNFFNNDEEAIIAVNGLYRHLTEAVMFTNTSGGVLASQMFGTDIGGMQAAVSFRIHEDYTMTEGNTRNQRTVWLTYYSVIYDANVIIDNVVGNNAISEDLRSRIEGEAIFLRSFAYYYLTSTWNHVPFYDSRLDIGEAATLERTNASQIRQSLIASLDDIEARNLLPASYSGADLGRPTIWAVKTLKAKLLLWEEDWSRALAECQEIITNSDRQILANYIDVYDVGDNAANPYHDELIFVFDFLSNGKRSLFPNFLIPRLRDEPADPADKQALEDALNANGDFENWTRRQRAHFIGLPDFVANHPNDNRKPWNVYNEYEGIALKHSYFRKFFFHAALNEPWTNHGQLKIIFRLADVVLMAAEAANASGQNLSGVAATALDALLLRAYGEGGYDINEYIGAGNAVRDKIRDEKKWELAGEAHRKIDLKRWGILIETYRNLSGGPFNGFIYDKGFDPRASVQDHQAYQPIPQEEILLNPNLLNTDPTNNGYR